MLLKKNNILFFIFLFGISFSLVGAPVVNAQSSIENTSGNSDVCGFKHVKVFDTDGSLLDAWGLRGDADGEFLHLHGIALDSKGNVYTTDEEKRIIQKFDSNGTFLTKWGIITKAADLAGDGEGLFSDKIEDIAVDAEDNVYVVDYGNNRIQKFDSNGNFITAWGEKGPGPGQFDRPWGVAFDSNGNVYVTDLYNYRVQVFDKNGEFLYMWGKEGTEPGNFIHIHAIAIDKNDHVYVSDARENGEIHKFDLKGNLIAEWGSPGVGDGQFTEQHGIDFDSKGNVYVLDTANQRVQKFTPDGELLSVWERPGVADNEFIMAQDVAIDQNDNVYISDVGPAHPEISYVERAIEENPPTCNLEIQENDDNR